MIRAIIVDDEPNAIHFISNALQKYCSDVEILGKVQSVEDALLLINNSTFDLLLLDIELLDGSGFDLLAQVKNPNFIVIFITAYNQYAVKAFKFNALDYLLKPLNIKELICAIDKVRIRLASSMPNKFDYHTLLENIKGQSFSKIAISSQTETVFVALTEIVRFEAYGNYSRLILNDRSQMVTSRTLKDYEQILDENMFFRIHHSHIININFLVKYIRKDGFSVLMHDGLSIPVATRRKDAFEEFMKSHFTNLK